MSLGNGIGYTSKVDGGGGSGTVTSVALAAPSIFTVSGSPVTVSGTLTFSLANQNANLVFAGPLAGGAAAPTFRALAAIDIPALPYGTGTVTSVGLAAPGIFTVSGSPVTISGTLTLSLANQNANLVFAGPSAGGAAVPTFRSLVAADLPGGSFWLVGGNSIPGASAFLGVTNNKPMDVGIVGSASPIFTFENGYMLSAGPIGLRSSFDKSVIEWTNNGMIIRGTDGGSASRGLRVQQLSGATGSNIFEAVYNTDLKSKINIAGTFDAVNTYTTSAAPTATLGSGAGTGALVSIGGTNQAGTITVTTGTGCATLSNFFTLTFSASFAYPNGSILILSPVSTTAQTYINDHTVGGTTTTAATSTGLIAPLDSTSYQFHYFIAGF